MTNHPRQSPSPLPGAPVFLADQLRAAGHDPASIPDMLRKGGGAVQIASPKGVQIELSLVDDRVRVKKVVLNSSVKVLYVDGRYEVFLTPPHNGYPDTIKAALQGQPISCLFEAPGFDRPDVTMGSVKTLRSETLLIELLCPREPD